jgi:hypothetical protein
MFYVRINKIKVFNNREGFLGLFNRTAEMRIYSLVSAPLAVSQALSLADLLDLDDRARKEKLLEAVLAEAGRFAQSQSLEINGVKDNQTLLFGDSGLVIYAGEQIPDSLDVQLWVIESDADIRSFALDADKVLDSDAFKGLFAAVETALAVTVPALSGVIAVSGVAISLLRQKLRANKDDLVGYWQVSLNRTEHYPHGTRDRQDVYDTTGNILVDYTLFGFENHLSPGPSPQGRGGMSETGGLLDGLSREKEDISFSGDKKADTVSEDHLSPGPSPQERGGMSETGGLLDRLSREKENVSFGGKDADTESEGSSTGHISPLPCGEGPGER